VLQTELLEVALKVVRLVPLNYGVFHFANATQIAMDFHDAVRVLVVAIFVIIQHGLLCGCVQLGQEPFDAAQVQHPLHAEEIDGDFDHVTFAHLDNRLGQRSLFNSIHIGCGAAITSLVFLLRFFGLVPVNPHETAPTFFDDI